jgi:hypothetical protein
MNTPGPRVRVVAMTFKIGKLGVFALASTDTEGVVYYQVTLRSTYAVPQIFGGVLVPTAMY